MLRLETGRPEEYGISQEVIAKLEALLEKRKVRIHGYMLLGGKKILAEKYYGPYGKDDNHRMYSITKSFVAIAVGLLVQKGKVSLDDRICDYFQDKLAAEGTHSWCEEMTIRDMLTMRTCYASTTYKKYDNDDWTETFFRVKPDHVPGTVFNYDTSSSHVLCDLVERISGMNMLDFMRKEVLDELGFSKEAYIIPDPVGVSQGGSGIMCTMTDIARFAYLCNHYGVIDGKEYVSKEYMREAVSYQVPTDIQVKLDESFGYGYFIWQTREEGFLLFGMGGQLAVCFPKYDFCYLTMADVIGSPAGVQILMDCFFETVYPCLKERKEDNPLAFEMEAEKNDNIDKSAQIRELTNNKTYRFYPNMLSWNQVAFDWENHKMSFTIPAGEFSFDFGDGKTWVLQPYFATGYTCECRGYWNKGHFFMECYVVDEEMGNVRMEFAFKDSRLTLHSTSTGEPFFTKLKSYFNGFASAKM